MPIHTPSDDLPAYAPGTLPLLHQALSQAGAAGATLDELHAAMTADGYQGDRMAVWVATCEARNQGTVYLEDGSGRAYAAGYGP
jgi:hypothetical protein